VEHLAIGTGVLILRSERQLRRGASGRENGNRETQVLAPLALLNIAASVAFAQSMLELWAVENLAS